MIIYSNFLKPNNSRSIDYFENYYLSFDNNGIINYFGNKFNEIQNFENDKLLDLTNHIILPALIDLHTHIPQYPAIGIGKGTLLDWLEQQIFPLEKKFDDIEYAYNLSLKVFEESIKFGTATIVAYSNLGYESTNSSFEAAKDMNIKAYIGNALMDFNLAKNLNKTTDYNIEISNKLIKKWHSESGKLKYILTPRYALVCSMKLMKWAAKISKENNIKIQTHLAENKDELKEVNKLYKNISNYTEVYNQAGILHDNTLLAHGIYLNDDEVKIIQSKGANIVHCPSSNRYLQSGILPLINMKNIVPIGLGTDVGGGVSLSMINEMKEAIETSKTFNITENISNNYLSAEEAIWIATKGNSKILKLDNEIGDFGTGKSADFICINKSRLNLNDNLSSNDIASKIIYQLSNQYVDSTYINGKKVY